MTETASDAEHLSNAADRIERAIDKLERPRGGHVVNAIVHAGAGGIGVWVCVTCVLIMFVVVVLQERDKARMTEDVRELRQDYDEMKAYLQVIYQQAPHLRPKSEKGKNE